MPIKITDPERRQLIVSRARKTKRNPTGRRLELHITAHSKGWFVGARGAKDLSCSSKERAIAEIAKLLDLLQREQQAGAR
jgi:hypothetical protein